MIESNVWEAPRAELPLKAFPFYPLEYVAVSCLIALIDVHTTNESSWTCTNLYAYYGLLASLRHGIKSLLLLILMPLALYLFHVAFILHGDKQPFVEPDLPSALSCFLTFPYVLLSVLPGLTIRYGIIFLIRAIRRLNSLFVSRSPEIPESDTIDDPKADQRS